MEKLRSRRGDVSILLVIMVFITLLFTSGYYNLVKKNYALSELQSMLDVAGVAVLEKVVNYGYLRDEIIAIDEHNQIDTETSTKLLKDYEKQIRSEYINLLDFNPDTIDSYTIEKQRAYFELSSWGTGKDMKTVPQIVVETVISVRMDVTVGTDYSKPFDASFYSSKEGSNFSVYSNGTTNDGLTELVIFSVVKSVYGG